MNINDGDGESTDLVHESEKAESAGGIGDARVGNTHGSATANQEAGNNNVD